MWDSRHPFILTTANGFLYAAALKCSEDGVYLTRSLGEQEASRQANFHGIIQDIELLGCSEKPRWSRIEAGLRLESPMTSDKPIVFRLRIG